MKKKIPSILQVLRSNHSVNLNLQKRLECHAQLLKLVTCVLPEPLAAHCTGCCLNSSTLVLYSRSVAWLSQLRFYKQVILETIQSNAPEYNVCNIVFRVLVTPDGLPLRENQSRPTKPSTHAIDEIADYARHVSDQRLRLSLDKLVQTLRKQSKPNA